MAVVVHAPADEWFFQQVVVVRLYFSGGSAIAETGIPDPSIMLSFYVTVKNGKPDKRLRRILSIRKKTRKKPILVKAKDKR